MQNSEVYVKYPSIENFKAKDFKRNKNRKITLFGQTKLHGTNASIRIFKGEYQAGGRNKLLTLESDNYAFAQFTHNPAVREFVEPRLRAILTSFMQSEEFITLQAAYPGEVQGVVLHGEWAGRGVQKNVIISEVDKFFAPFDIAVIYKPEEQEEVNLWLNTEYLEGFRNEEHRIFPIAELWRIDIDLDDVNSIKQAYDEMQELTLQVEQEDPFALTEFGLSGLGEGIVWKTSDIIFRTTIKTKGSKHAGKSSRDKVKSEVNFEEMAKNQQFAEKHVSTRRLQQGLEYLQEFNIPIDNKAIGEFIKFVLGDILKEEMKEAYELGVSVKSIKANVPKIAANCFKQYLATGEF